MVRVLTKSTFTLLGSKQVRINLGKVHNSFAHLHLMCRLCDFIDDFSFLSINKKLMKQ